MTSEVNVSDILFGRRTYQKENLRNKILALICLQRPMVILNAYPLVIGTAIAATGNIPSFLKIIQALFSYYFGVASMHTINDVFDKERDRRKWPLRPIPSKMVSIELAIIYGVILGALSLVTAYLWFNLATSLLILLVIFLGTIYTGFTRDKIGWLTGIFPPAFIVIGAWVAFSPLNIFVLLPWLLFLFMVVHQVGMIGAEEHPGQTGTIKPFLREVNNKEASYLFPISIAGLFLVGVMIHFVASLHWIHLLLLVILTAIGSFTSFKMVKNPTQENFEKGFEAIISYNIFYWLGLSLGIIL